MSRRAYVSFAECKQKISMPDVLEEFGIADQFRWEGRTLVGCCPLPQHVHGPSPNAEQFKINQLDDGVWVWHCFGDCQRGGDVIEFVKLMTGRSDAHVRFWFAEFAERHAKGLTLRKKAPRRQNETPKKREEAPEAPPTPLQAESLQAEDDQQQHHRHHHHHDHHHHQQRQEHQRGGSSAAELLRPLRFKLNLDPDVQYLKQRGLTDETIRRFGLGLANRGLMKGYIAIPVYCHPPTGEGLPVAYLGRWPGEDFDAENGRPRYKWPPNFEKHRILYGLSEALDGTDGQPLIVVEGCFDLYHVAQAGFRAVVATFGSSLSEEQAALLVSTGRPIVLMFDGDQAGQAGMLKAAAVLIRRAFVRIVQLDGDPQPDDLFPGELKDVLSFLS